MGGGVCAEAALAIATDEEENSGEADGWDGNPPSSISQVSED